MTQPTSGSPQPTTQSPAGTVGLVSPASPASPATLAAQGVEVGGVPSHQVHNSLFTPPRNATPANPANAFTLGLDDLDARVTSLSNNVVNQGSKVDALTTFATETISRFKEVDANFTVTNQELSAIFERLRALEDSNARLRNDHAQHVHDTIAGLELLSSRTVRFEEPDDRGSHRSASGDEGEGSAVDEQAEEAVAPESVDPAALAAIQRQLDSNVRTGTWDYFFNGLLVYEDNPNWSQSEHDTAYAPHRRGLRYPKPSRQQRRDEYRAPESRDKKPSRNGGGASDRDGSNRPTQPNQGNSGHASRNKGDRRTNRSDDDVSDNNRNHSNRNRSRSRNRDQTNNRNRSNSRGGGGRRRQDSDSEETDNRRRNKNSSGKNQNRGQSRGRSSDSRGPSTKGGKNRENRPLDLPGPKRPEDIQKESRPKETRQSSSGDAPPQATAARAPSRPRSSNQSSTQLASMAPGASASNRPSQTPTNTPNSTPRVTRGPAAPGTTPAPRTAPFSSSQAFADLAAFQKRSSQPTSSTAQSGGSQASAPVTSASFFASVGSPMPTQSSSQPASQAGQGPATVPASTSTSIPPRNPAPAPPPTQTMSMATNPNLSGPIL